jgi:hypothetical protein
MDKAKSAISDLANGQGGIPQALETLAEPLGLTDQTGLFDITLTKVLQGDREPENEMALYSHTDPSLTALPSVIPDDGPSIASWTPVSVSSGQVLMTIYSVCSLRLGQLPSRRPQLAPQHIANSQSNI